MIDMLKRHAIQVLRHAGHDQDEIARLVGVGVCTVRRVEAEADVTHIDDVQERERRAIGRPAKAEPSASFCIDLWPMISGRRSGSEVASKSQTARSCPSGDGSASKSIERSISRRASAMPISVIASSAEMEPTGNETPSSLESTYKPCIRRM